MYDFDEIYEAYMECRKNKRNSINALKFEVNLIDNLWKLYEDINSFRYKPKRYIYFLTHSPKLREVFASDFRDRVVHHLLIRDLEPLFEPVFIYDSYSCRKNRGIHLAIKRLQKFVQNREYNWYLQLDLKSFFLSINKNILFKKIVQKVNFNFTNKGEFSPPDKKSETKVITSERILYLASKIIFDDPTKNYIFKGKKENIKKLPPHKTLFNMPKNQGLPIGNLTSQFFANVYLNDFDNFIKRSLKVKYYMRYVDDFILLAKSKIELLDLKDEIENYLRYELKLQLRDRYFLKQTKQGIDFLGYIVKPTHTLVRQRVVNNFKYKKAKFLDECFNEVKSLFPLNKTCSLEDAKKFKELNASYYGHFKHADSYKLIQKYQMKNWIKDER